MTQPTYDLLNYRFFADDNTGEDDQTALGTGNNQTLDRQTGTANRFCVRIELYNDNGKAGNEIFQWQYSYDSGAWTNITAASSVIKGYDSANLTEGENCTQRLSSSTPYLAANAGVTEDGLTGTVPATAGCYLELLLSCYIVDADVADGKTIDIRVIETSTDTITYTNTPALTVDKAAAPLTVNLSNGSVTATGQVITIVPGAASISLTNAAITATGQVITIPITVNLDAASIVATGQIITIVPAAVAVSLLAAALTASGQVITIVPGVVAISLSAASLTAAGQVITITPSAAVISLTHGALTATGQVITIDAGGVPVNINLDAASLTASGQVITIIPAVASTSLGVANLTAAGQIITIPVTVNLDAASLTASGQNTSIVPGAVATSLSAGLLTAVGQVVGIIPGAVAIDLASGLITASGQVITIATGATIIRFRIQDSSNYWQVTIDSGGNLDLDEVVANVAVQRGTSAGVVNNGDRIAIVLDDTTIRVIEQNTVRIVYAIANNFKTETSGKLQSDGTGGTVSDIVSWPRALPVAAETELDKYT